MGGKANQFTIIGKKLIKRRASLYYPKITGLKDIGVEKFVNTTIEEEIYKAIVELGYIGDYTREVSCSYSVKLKTARLLSLLLDLKSKEGKFPYNQRILRALNFDLCRGQLLQLEDIFIKGHEYLSPINRHIKSEICRRGISLLVDFETIDIQQEFYLTRNSLFIFFQSNEYTHYKYGILEFEINYNSFRDLFDYTGPISGI